MRVELRSFLGIAGLVGAALLAACAALPPALQQQQLEERLHVADKCTLMGSSEPSTACTAVRQALIGTKQSEGDRFALSCFDALHANKAKTARKAFESGLAKEPSNPHVLACGKELAAHTK